MTDDSRDPTPSPSEPSVLDYLKSKLSFGRRPRVEIPLPASTEPASEAMGHEQAEAAAGTASVVPWRSIGALVLAIIGQRLFEPPGRHGVGGSIAYLVALALVVWAAVRGEWNLGSRGESQDGGDPMTFRRRAFILSLPLAVIAFLTLSDNLFTTFNVALWLGAIALFAWSLWLPNEEHASLWQRLRSLVSQPGWEIRIDRRTLLLAAAALLVLFFRLYNLQHTPAEPFSDHAEKLLDVYDVSRGQTHIFFPRNTGREAIQMYWTLLIARVFGTGLSFLSLKLGTALIGLLTLPYIYLFGKEVGGRRVALLALVLAGIAYWPNVISRVGLRFPLYPMFVAPLMFHLARGLRTRNRNDFILAGIFLGLGLHGYSPYRIVPLLVVAAFAVYLPNAQSKGARRSAVLWLIIITLASVLVFLPLLRYAMENPDSFSNRAMSRLGSTEQPLPGPWYQIFLSNTWSALRMFNWDNGNIWVHSLPGRPAMDVVTAALFMIGVVLVLVRYAQEQHWLDLWLLLSIPILLLPSILSLAFPDENPSLNRTAGAIVPAFVIAALALDGLISAFNSGRWRRTAGYALTVLLLWASASQNFDLVFRQYNENFRNGAWNTSEMGALIKQFGDVYGETDTAWVIPFPYWVDTRLVGVWAGIPNRDFAMWSDQLPETLSYEGPKLFMARANLEKPELNDQKAIDALKALYPQGSLSLHRSQIAGHEFWVYFVPASSTP
ncbi:MAG TPA: glycosyltransferase family 39 protein [Anaerolineales bacterium]